MNLEEKIDLAAQHILNSSYTMVFSGAGISVESGIPPFRGPTGLWAKYDPSILDKTRFLSEPSVVWPTIKEIFYDFYARAAPNPAHSALAKMEAMGYVKMVMTQNIDGLHQQAGSQEVYEYHGRLRTLQCIDCLKTFDYHTDLLKILPAQCPNCSGLLKPDFVFFGEGIPQIAHKNAILGAQLADCILIIGTTGEIQPASQIPLIAAQRGAHVIEINIEKSRYTDSITHNFIQEKASIALTKILERIKKIQ